MNDLIPIDEWNRKYGVRWATDKEVRAEYKMSLQQWMERWRKVEEIGKKGKK